MSTKNVVDEIVARKSRASRHEDLLYSFRRAMEDAGLKSRDAIVADDTLHRIHVEGDKKGSRNGWYILHLADGVPAGAFGSWRGATHRWSAKGAAPMSEEERRAHRAKMKDDAARRAA